jgi:anhydro-N-acetylmuramic acid kinase
MVLAEYAARVPADLLRTLVEYVALAVAQELTRLSPSCGLLLITGGGAHNGFLVERLQKALQPLGIVPEVPAAQIVDQKEALAFAFLGLNTLLGRPNTLPDATGARRAVCAGGIHRP